jgi:hypothetical protein
MNIKWYNEPKYEVIKPRDVVRVAFKETEPSVPVVVKRVEPHNTLQRIYFNDHSSERYYTSLKRGYVVGRILA